MENSAFLEKEKLLHSDEPTSSNDPSAIIGGDLRRVSSSRFQVSRFPEEESNPTPSVHSEEPLSRCKSSSEPPVFLSHSGSAPVVQRKMSATGRFMVVSETASTALTQNNSQTGLDGEPRLETARSVDVTSSEAVVPTTGVEPPLAEAPEDLEDSVTAPLNRSRGVHFSVGDREAFDASMNGQTAKREYSQENNATLNMKSWRNMRTIEHPPIIDFYRNSVDTDAIVVRPSMAQLIHGDSAMIPEEEINFDDLDFHNHELANVQIIKGVIGDGASEDERKTPRVEKFAPPQPQQARVKFGWVQGVFVRWVAGQAGIGLGCMIVLLASVVTTVTALSTCAICTNGDVKGGGAYFLISRSLGPEFGGSIGIIFSVANAVGAAMYVVGFAETVRDVLLEYGFTIIDGAEWDVRIIGFATALVLMAVVFIGTEFESKMQMGLLCILLLSIANYVVGSFLPPNEMMMRRGVTGYSWSTATENFFPAFRDGEDFFSVFAVYFPAATGIMAGANISGDLADPQRAIPIGTLLAIVVTTIVYLVTVLMTGSTCVRDADGVSYPIFNLTSYVPPDCVDSEEGCKYGLMNYFQVMEMESLWGPLITAGIFAATLSSALASLVSAPKVFQAVCKDRLFPGTSYFAKVYGKNEEPRRAYLLGFVIAFSMIAIGDLNAIAPIISNFFLASYTLINYACFDQSFADSPGFRPGFKYYNMWVSLAGSILCIVVMFVMSWSTALITFFCFGALFMYIFHRKPDVNWGSSTQAHSYKNALSGMIKLSNTEEHVKNYRPQFLVLTGNPTARSALVDFAYNICKGTSMMVCGYVVPYEPSDRIFSLCRRFERQCNEWLRKRRVKAFYTSVACPSLRAGTRGLLQLSGLGKLRPNIVLMGFKSNWCRTDGEGNSPSETQLAEINDYFGTIQDAFDCNMGVCVLRNSRSGLDFSELMQQLNVDTNNLFPSVNRSGGASSGSSTFRSVKTNEEDGNNNEELEKLKEAKEGEEKDHQDVEEDMSNKSLLEAFMGLYDDDDDVTNEEDEQKEESPAEKDVEKKAADNRKNHTFSLRRRNSRRATVEQKALIASMSRFQRKVKKGVIDVWWLYDDGGLTFVDPAFVDNSEKVIWREPEQRGMAALLSKFRIDFSDVAVIADLGRKPKPETVSEWETAIAPFVWTKDEGNGVCPPGMITTSELLAQKEKTWRQLRACELLKHHSSQADLIVMTLPVPRKGLVSAALYLSWLDMMTRGLPPTLLVRGNQQSVLTFYS
ncbi:unnamed protein product [Caenorhabditis auriculariae]|uniref:Uncharacterized protein n=1 Tax=Caenorhabditis auriculariae TaxID=2777116 RepID=A0A8S1HS48_9PELO|nr:unnamed protein product [Caenorhabditis auriculariae]